MMRAEDFWTWFESESIALLSLDDSEAIVDRIYEQIRLVEPHLSVEIDDLADAPQRELIISAGGDRRLFSVVADLVNSAPPLQYWTITALKPPKGFGFRITSGQTVLNPKEWGFIPMETKADPGALGIRLVLPANSPMPSPDMARLIVETGIGEEAAAYIQRIESIADDMTEETILRLPVLSDYVAWHKRRHATNPET